MKGVLLMGVKKRLALTLGGLAVLAAEWALVRFPLFGLHRMKDWPWILFIFGLIVVAIAGASGAKWVIFGTLAGYPAGFFCGEILDYPDKTMDWWVWTCVFLAGILLGTALSIIFAMRKKLHN